MLDCGRNISCYCKAVHKLEYTIPNGTIVNENELIITATILNTSRKAYLNIEFQMLT